MEADRAHGTVHAQRRPHHRLRRSLLRRPAVVHRPADRRHLSQGVILPPYDAPQHVIAACQLSGGALGLVEVGWLYCKQTRDQGSQFQIEVIGQTGTLSFDAATGQIKVYTQTDTQIIELPDATNKDFSTTYDLLARSLDDNTLHDLGSAEDGLAATQAAYAALASAKG